MHRLQRVLDGLGDRVDTPMPIVLADVMQRNIDRMQALASERGMDLRRHVKTHKCVEIGRRQVAAGCRSASLRATWGRPKSSPPRGSTTSSSLTRSGPRGRRRPRTGVLA